MKQRKVTERNSTSHTLRVSLFIYMVLTNIIQTLCTKDKSLKEWKI